jgi:hypothetical protein
MKFVSNYIVFVKHLSWTRWGIEIYPIGKVRLLDRQDESNIQQVP